MDHELGHILAGTDSEPDPTNPLRLPESRIGLKRMFGDNLGAQILEEAVNEHFTDSLIYGHIESTDPMSKHRENNRNIYRWERLSLYVFCEEGLEPIDPRLFVRAQLTNGSAEIKEFIELEDAIERSFLGMKVTDRIRNFTAQTDETEDLAAKRFAQELYDDISAIKRAA